MSAEPDPTNPRTYTARARAITLNVKGIPGKDDSIIDLALTLTETLALGDQDPDRTGRLAAASALANELAEALDRDRTAARERGLSRARALAENLEDALAAFRSVELANSPATALTDDRPEAHASPPGAARPPEPLPSARRLLALAVRLLPEAAQPRYAEEFRSELAELTRIGSGRWAQLTYSTRLVVRIWQLRAALKAPRRRGAVQ